MTDENWPRPVPKSTNCAHCGAVFEFHSFSQAKHVTYEGQVPYCSDICRSAARQERFRAAHTFGPCPTCGQRFESRVKKTFCSLRCYLKSPQWKEMLARNREKIATKEKHVSGGYEERRVCENCGGEFTVNRPSSTKKFCGRTCYHAYMAGRFDRHVAAPDKIRIAQAYDEFLDGEELACPMPDCDWHGAQLALHVNFAHGITAREFKRAAGFNLKEGVISRPLRDALENRVGVGVAALTPEQREALPELLRQAAADKRRTEGYVSHQARESIRKRRALISEEGTAGPERACHGCGRLFQQSTPFGRAKFCSVACRTRASHSASGELACDGCGSAFQANHNQLIRHRNGSPVVCSAQCRGRINGPKRARDKAVPKDQGLQCAVCGTDFMGTRPQEIRAHRGQPVVCSTACRTRLTAHGTSKDSEPREKTVPG